MPMMPHVMGHNAVFQWGFTPMPGYSILFAKRNWPFESGPGGRTTPVIFLLGIPTLGFYLKSLRSPKFRGSKYVEIISAQCHKGPPWFEPLLRSFSMACISETRTLPRALQTAFDMFDMGHGSKSIEDLLTSHLALSQNWIPTPTLNSLAPFPHFSISVKWALPPFLRQTQGLVPLQQAPGFEMLWLQDYMDLFDTPSPHPTVPRRNRPLGEAAPVTRLGFLVKSNRGARLWQGGRVLWLWPGWLWLQASRGGMQRKNGPQTIFFFWSIGKTCLYKLNIMIPQHLVINWRFFFQTWSRFKLVKDE